MYATGLYIYILSKSLIHSNLLLLLTYILVLVSQQALKEDNFQNLISYVLAFETQIRSLSTNSSSYAFSSECSLSAVVAEPALQLRPPRSAVPLPLLPAVFVPQVPQDISS